MKTPTSSTPARPNRMARWSPTAAASFASTALGENVKLAQKRSYEVLTQIDWDGMQYRKDIGYRAISRITQGDNDESRAAASAARFLPPETKWIPSN